MPAPSTWGSFPLPSGAKAEHVLPRARESLSEVRLPLLVTQDLSGIDLCCAPGRQVAGRQGDRGEKHGHAQEGVWIGTTNCTTRVRPQPSAIRTPTSFARWLTVYDMTP